VRENANPDFSFTLEVAVDGNTAGFDLAIGDPITAETLESVFTETYFRSTLGVPGAAPAVRLTELHSFGHQWHSYCPLRLKK
jgi:hypothetical protein